MVCAWAALLLTMKAPELHPLQVLGHCQARLWLCLQLGSAAPRASSTQSEVGDICTAAVAAEIPQGQDNVAQLRQTAGRAAN